MQENTRWNRNVILKNYGRANLICILMLGTLTAQPWHDPVLPHHFQQNPTIMNVKNIYGALDYGALAYVLYRTALLYHNKTEFPICESKLGSFLKKSIDYACPSFIAQAGAQTLFFCQVLGIVGETLFYKTMAKLIVFCGHGDLFDLVKRKTTCTKNSTVHCAGATELCKAEVSV